MIVKSDRPLSANEQLLDRAIAHAHYLERLKTFEVRRVVGLLNNDVLPDLVDRISSRLERLRARGFDVQVTSNVGYRDLIAGMRDILDSGMRRLSDHVESSLVDIGASEAKWQANAIARIAGPQIRFEFDMPSVSTLRSIVTSRPMQGQIIGDWFKDLGKTTQTRLTREINIGIASSESVEDIVRRIRGTREARYSDGVLQITRNNAESVVRTAVNHVSSHARAELAAENDDIVKGEMMVATLDLGTTDYCKNIDGKVFPVGEGPRPPFHFKCRTTPVPVLKSWKELGLSLKELAPGTRASMDGQVPASTTYTEWLARQSADRQDQALGGPGRGALYRRGAVTIDRFVDGRGRPLSLRELEQLEAREAA